MSNLERDIRKFTRNPSTRDGKWTYTDWQYIDREAYRLMYLDGDHANNPDDYVNQAIDNLLKKGKI